MDAIALLEEHRCLVGEIVLVEDAVVVALNLHIIQLYLLKGKIVKEVDRVHDALDLMKPSFGLSADLEGKVDFRVGFKQHGWSGLKNERGLYILLPINFHLIVVNEGKVYIPGYSKNLYVYR